jgi:hypothetical protein
VVGTRDADDATPVEPCDLPGDDPTAPAAPETTPVTRERARRRLASRSTQSCRAYRGRRAPSTLKPTLCPRVAVATARRSCTPPSRILQVVAPRDGIARIVLLHVRLRDGSTTPARMTSPTGHDSRMRNRVYKGPPRDTVPGLAPRRSRDQGPAPQPPRSQIAAVRRRVCSRAVLSCPSPPSSARSSSIGTAPHPGHPPRGCDLIRRFPPVAGPR